MRSSILVLLSVTVLTLTACGDDPVTTADTAPDAPVPTADPAPADRAPANDEPIGAGPYPIADLTITFDPGDGSPVTYRLACLGDTATFTGDTALSAADACLALTEPEVRARLLTDAHLDRMCTQQYGGPETATVSGTLDGDPVETTVGRADGCGIADWSVTLSALLPPAG